MKIWILFPVVVILAIACSGGTDRAQLATTALADDESPLSQSLATALAITPTPIPPSLIETEDPRWDPPVDSIVSFAVIGDYGAAGPAATSVANMIDDWNIDLIITTGDNNYHDGTAEEIDGNIGRLYQAYIGNYAGTFGPGADENRFFPAMGNHDWRTEAAKPYLDYFTLPGNERYYDFVFGNVHFWAIDSDPMEPDGIYLEKKTPDQLENPEGVILENTQALWLKAGLTASTEPFNVVFFHHPVFSSRWRSPTLLEWPYKEWGADIVLTGHGHHYERIVRDGFNYVTNGLGGHPTIHDFGELPPVEGSVVQYMDDFGAMRMYATDDVLDVKFITRTGEVIDSFSLTP
jgi:tartrate-resistant acid phosphatase type 5